MNILSHLIYFGLSVLLVTPCFGLEHQVDFHSQASQDEFVHVLLHDVLNKEDPGYYLEVGAGSPTLHSNTYFLEKNFDWKGISLDISTSTTENWDTLRTNPLLIEDATKAEYREILAPLPSVIDFLSLDIDGPHDEVLNQIPFDDYIFNIMTIEHDFYRFGPELRDKERELLSNWGYHLLCPDVCHPAVGSFEDWWIHPTCFPHELFVKLTALDLKTKDHQQIVKVIREALLNH